MPFKIVRNDITKMKVDAIVNATNPSLKMGGGVSGAIFSAAGPEKLQAECNAIGNCDPGDAVITSGFSLPCKYIIHTVGPVWQGGNSGEKQVLQNCYINSLDLALRNKCESIAFPLIASGVYEYPKDKALMTAVASISEFILENEIMVYLVVYDRESYGISEKLFASIEKYIEDNYVDSNYYSDRLTTSEIHRRPLNAYPVAQSSGSRPAARIKRNLKDVVDQLEGTFSQMLLRLIDEKGLTDVQVYKRANIDRRLFSKIRSNTDYNPNKTTAIAFAIALELNIDETQDLLGKAGYTLSHSNKFDVIIEYFIDDNNYDIFEINQALFAFDQTTLGA